MENLIERLRTFVACDGGDLADVEEAADEIERLRADATRYRWLRDSHTADGELWVAMGVPYSPAGMSCWRHEELDAFIDAKLTEQANGK